MDNLIPFAVIGSAIWVYIDAKSLNVRRGVLEGFFNIGPLGWAIGCLLLWIIAFPMYLIKRDDLKRAFSTPVASGAASEPVTAIPSNTVMANMPAMGPVSGQASVLEMASSTNMQPEIIADAAQNDSGKPVAAAKEWYYIRNGERMGPCSQDDIAGLMRSGVLSRTSVVWTGGFTEWQKIEHTELASLIDHAVVPPTPAHQVNNTVVWFLAFAPILGLILEYMIANMYYQNEYRANNAVESGDLWFITLLLNIALSILDEKKLEKAGYNTEAFGKWVWLVPVYLYQRSKYLGHNNAYFIVWIVCFAIILLGL